MDHYPGYVCLVDCATTHTILRDKKYFCNLTLVPFNVQTILGPVDLIKGSRRDTIVFPNGTKFQIIMPFTLINLFEIYLVLRIFAEMDITMKL